VILDDSGGADRQLGRRHAQGVILDDSGGVDSQKLSVQ